MKAFIITVKQIPQSVDCGERALRSAQKHNLEAFIHQGVYRDESRLEAKKRNLKINLIDKNNSSNHEALIGCFLSHLTLWEKCLQLQEPILIMEHDCIVKDNIPNIPDKWNIVNLGKPSYNKLKKPKKRYLWQTIINSQIIIKHYSMSHLPGAHAYYITPTGANQLISTANITGVMEPDHFINRERFPKLGEVYPWPAIAAPIFSSIQNTEGANHQHDLRNLSS